MPPHVPLEFRNVDYCAISNSLKCSAFADYSCVLFQGLRLEEFCNCLVRNCR